jgi:transposase
VFVASATRIAELEAALEELRQSNEELRRKLGMNSLNSSLPPSRDDAEAKGKRREKAKSAKQARRREKASRRRNRSNCTLLPPDKVTSSQTSYPTHCDECGKRRYACHRLAGPERIQNYDLDDDHRLLVHEIQIYSGKCPYCHAVTKGLRPPEANTTKVGPLLRAFIVLLLVRFHLSRRDVIAFLSEIRGVSISLGLL